MDCPLLKIRRPVAVTIGNLAPFKELRPLPKAYNLNMMSQAGAGSRAGRILAIDYGRKRLGVAISDALGVIAQPFATWNRTTNRRDIARLRTLCRQQGVGRIVVGWPLQLSGGRGKMADEAARFADVIRKELGLVVELVDERLTSWEAQQALDEAEKAPSHSRRKRRKMDEVAAAVILRDYLTRTTGAS
jgi:putative holliday junction resolvase